MDLVCFGVRRETRSYQTRSSCVAVAGRIDVGDSAQGTRRQRRGEVVCFIANNPRDVPGHPHPFSQAYEYCYVDSEGRPMIVHRRLVFLLPDAPPEVNDRTFIESGECQ